MRRQKARIPGVDAGLLMKDAARLLPDPSRRMFLRGASLGSLALLTGCSIVDGPSAENALRVVSQFNDWVQARLFSPSRLAPTYPDSAITRPFRFNAFIRKRGAPMSTRTSTGSSSTAWSRASSRGRWSSSTRCRRRRSTSRGSSASRAGARSANGPGRRCASSCAASARSAAKYVHFVCAEGYSVSIDMPRRCIRKPR